MNHSKQDIRQIEEKAKEDQRKAEKAKAVVKDAQKSANPQRENSEFKTND
ncbi:hypothetical protein ABFG93_03235 [Pseudalkalibacillus hwajinpoensis]